ncbi:uncharacterized protein LOC143201173 [Rhynchophorus ferrugineus]|uniref:uncharacterized protein LOC143201173 n=1 Tax=Rhynchophorus ferrugineus TaxID=354439 RepID=UPI003FCDCA5E
MAASVNKILSVLLVFMICVVDLNFALNCLSCQSDDLYGACRLGQRKFKPKLEKCQGPTARCFAVATVGDNGKDLYQRGCAETTSFCQDIKSDFCQVCGSQFCNYGAMTIPGVIDEEPEVTTLLSSAKARKTIRRLPAPST